MGIHRIPSLSQATGSTPGGKFGGREQRTGWAAGSRQLWYYLCLQGTSVRIHELVLRKTSIVFDKDYVSYVTARFSKKFCTPKGTFDNATLNAKETINCPQSNDSLRFEGRYLLSY